MISYIKGTVLEKSNNFLIIENSGIGYKVYPTPDLLIKQTGEHIQAYIYHRVSEDDESLFGLPDLATLTFFELLISVSGVGPKMALGMLSHASPQVLSGAIASGDSTFFTRMSGVGKKTAERIIVELKSKLAADFTPHTQSSSATYDALISLGYSILEARNALTDINPELSENDQLKAALKILSKK